MVAYEAGGCGPGPIYRPNIKFVSTGPSGRGPEFTIPPRTFHASIRDKKTMQDAAPGPKYSKPQSVGPQIESMYPSQQITKFGSAERVTVAATPTSTGDIGCARPPGAPHAPRDAQIPPQISMLHNPRDAKVPQTCEGGVGHLCAARSSRGRHGPSERGTSR